MGSIEEVTEKPGPELDVWSIQSQNHQISRPPTYSTVNTGDKSEQTSHCQTVQMSKGVFEEEFEKFCSEFTNGPKQENKLEFFQRIKAQNATANVEDVQNIVESLVKGSVDKKLRRVYSAFAPVVEALIDYTGVIDTMIQAYPMPLALIWGGLKIVIDCAGRYSSQFEKIKNEVQRLPDILWDLSSCEEIYGISPYGADVVRRAISTSYRTIFKFWYRAAKILEHPKRYVLMENRKLSGLVVDLERNWETLSKIRVGVEAQLNHEMREKIAVEAKSAMNMRQGLTEEFVKTALERSAAQIGREMAEEERIKAEVERAAAQKDRELAQIERENAAKERTVAEEARKEANLFRVVDLTWKCEQNRFQAGLEMRSLMTRLEAYDDFSVGVFNNILADRHPGTCEWLFKNDYFLGWAAEDSKSSVLWLNGKHGAGKSFLCASAIDFIRGNSTTKRTAFQFLTKDSVSRAQLLRNLAYQLLGCHISESSETPTSLKPFLQINRDDSGSLERLVHFLLLELPFTYIFVDGLDEADYNDTHHLGYLHRHNKEVPDFVTFLIREAVQFPEKLRLWCSSQPSPRVQEYLCQPVWKNVITEIPLTIEDTSDDIQRYLLSAIPDSTPDTMTFAKSLIQGAVATEVEGSFLWASSMLDGLKEDAEDVDDLLRLASEGLPNRMSDVYSNAIERMKKLDSGNKKLPLWKIVLSLLTFARRPLKLAEIIEAVATVRTSKGQNISDNKHVDPRKILSCCLSLVRHIKIDGNCLNDILHLSHSAVRTFLLKNSDVVDVAPGDGQELVSSQIIRDCCLTYLSQPKYEKLLSRDSFGVFWTEDDEDIRSHSFLSYAAKYWYQHFDTDFDNLGPISPDPGDKLDVIKFITSTNFQTCIQVQSLYVIGHFIQRSDDITDQVQSVRRTLPNWISFRGPRLSITKDELDAKKPIEEDGIHRQYLEWQGEWCELLQCGQSRQFSGEVDRCFWTALGPSNFLSHNTGRYQSFQIIQNGNGEVSDKNCRFQQVSSDGKRLTVCWVSSQEDSNQLTVEQWNIDGVNIPQLLEQTTIPFSAADSQLDFYSLPCSKTFHSFPLIPNTTCVVPPKAISVSLGASAIRIGAKLFGKGTTITNGVFHEMKKRTLDDCWEDLQVRGPYLVTCRRRIPRAQPSSSSRAKEAERARKARQRESSFQIRDCQRSNARKSNADSSDEDSQNAAEEEEPESEYSSDESELASLPDISSAEESWSEGSDTEDFSEDESDFEEAQVSESGDSENELDAQKVETSVESGSEMKSARTAPSNDESGDDDEDSVDSLVSFDEPADTDSESDDSDIQSDISERSELDPELFRPKDQEPLYPVSIQGVTGIRWCDGCNEERDLSSYLHCLECMDNDFDLCFKCERRGRWCFDKKHQMYRTVNLKVTGVASRMNFTAQQELNVYRTDSNDTKSRIFRFRRNYSTMLYDSPPIIHPKHPLVVWAVSGERILFADFEGNTFYEQKINSFMSKKARPICVDLSFSSCGGFLRVANIDAIVENTCGSPRNRCHRTSVTKPKLCLNLHVMILKLSKNKPTKIPPKMVATTSLRLGCGMRPHVQVLPFAFTWGADDLYLTISHSRLRVYRVSLPSVQSTLSTPTTDTTQKPNNEFAVTVPKECIFLPRSARNRSVQFFPPNAEGANSVIIVGPRYGNHPAPSIGVYLKDQDLGDWVPMDDKDGEGQLHTPMKRLEGQLFEQFDEENDCDIIPFD